ncbi:hypothetical protein WJX77_005954 [Trebouxia sp. C0004]
MPALAGIKRIRQDFEDDLAQLKDTLLQALAQHKSDGADLDATLKVFQHDSADSFSEQNMPFVLRVTLQHLISEAGKAQEPLLTYRLSSSSQPAVQTLLKVVIRLADKAILIGDVFQLVEDIVDTNKIEDVKACFSFMDGYWAQLREKPLKLSSATLLRFQKACNMFTRRVSNNQDAEILGAVSFQVAKMLPYNDTAGLNKPFNANDSHKTPMDKEIGASVDDSVPIDLKLYQQLWGLQSAFQDPHEQGEPNKWLSAVSSIQAVLNKLKEEPVGVASRSTAVPQDGGKSMIVKYLTSSKLTKLQLRDAAFRRTLLVQCLILLHACAHPKHAVNKPPTHQLKEKQVQELAQLQQQLYEELSRTPKRGAAFTDVVKTVLERETAFVKWKSEGASPCWDVAGSGPDIKASLDRPLPAVPLKQAPAEIMGNEPDTVLHLNRILDSSGAEEDLYRKNRDERMLPTADVHFSQIGRELAGDVMKRRQYATAGAPNGVDALYLFRSQRMLQHKNVDIWERATQIDSSGERLEIAFADLYPQKLPANWKRPKVDIRSPVQNGIRKVIGKPAAVSAADTNEGDKQAADSATMEATPAAAKQDAAQSKPTQAGDVPMGAEAAVADLGAQTVQHKQDAQDANDAMTVHVEADTAQIVKPEAVVHQSASNAAANRTDAQKTDAGLAANQASASNDVKKEQDKAPASVPKSVEHHALLSKSTQGALGDSPMSLASNALDAAVAPGQPQTDITAKKASSLDLGVTGNHAMGLDKREADAAVPMDENNF